MRLSEAARTQVAALHHHYREKQRPEASRNLAAALRDGARQIALGKGLPAPRPYPSLARPGEAWILAAHYWIAYSTASPPVILAVFHDGADIPGRI